MLRELLSIFREPGRPMAKMGELFREMSRLALDNTIAAGEIYFGKKASASDRSAIYEKDIAINQLERKVRKRVATHLSIHGNRPDVPYCLLLMSLVKDVERLGDYAKNLSEVVEVHADPFPDDEIFQELGEIRREVEEAFKSSLPIFEENDRERAMHFIHSGRDIAHRCDTLITKIGASDYGASLAVAATLGTRYYKRISGHNLNILSSVVMPLHKIDYFDEDDVPELERPVADVIDDDDDDDAT